MEEQIASTRSTTVLPTPVFFRFFHEKKFIKPFKMGYNLEDLDTKNQMVKIILDLNA